MLTIHRIRPLLPFAALSGSLLRWVLIGSALGVLVPAWSQTPPEEVVQMEAFSVSTTIGKYHEDTSSMATKIPMNLREVASSLQILNASALTDRNATTLQDVYTYIIGMNQVQTNANGFTFRGFSNTGTFTQNIEYDGLQGASSSKGALSAANVENVEFLKGPNSVLYGQMHPGGMLNIVTKSPTQTKQTNVRTSFITYAGRYNDLGSSNGIIGSFDTAGPIDAEKHWLYRLVVSGQDLHPFRQGDYERDLYLYPSLTYQWSKETSVTVKLENIRERRRLDDGLTPVFNQASLVAPLNTVYEELGDTARDEGSTLSAFFTTQWNHNWTFRAHHRATWHRDITRGLRQNGGSVKSVLPLTNSTITRQYQNVNNGHRYNYFDLNLYGSLGTPQLTHTVIVGTGGGWEAFDNHRVGNGPNVAPIAVFDPVLGVTPYPADGTRPTWPQQRLNSLGAYAMDQIKIGERFHLSFGSRYDQQGAHGSDPLNQVTSPYVHQFVTAVTSQAGMVFDLTKSVSAYASWSQSFVPATVTQIDATGKSGFPSERGVQREAGLKWESAERTLFSSLAIYQLIRSNVSVSTGLQLPTGQGIFRLDGEQRSQGFEWETEWRPIENWQLQGGFAYSKAYISASSKNPTTVGLDLVNAPHGSGSFWSRYNFPNGKLKGLGAGVGVNYVGKQWAGDPTTSGYFPVPGWVRSDAAFYYKWKRYEVDFDAKNLFDRKYILAATNAIQLIPGEARKLTLSFAARF